MLAYKTTWYGSRLVEADRWYPSSKTCSGCGSRKPRLSLSERSYECQRCGVILDRDLNAAVNLARLGDPRWEMGTGTGSSPAARHRVGEGRGAAQETEPAPTGDAAGCEASTLHRLRAGKAGTASSQGEATDDQDVLTSCVPR